MSSNSWAVHYVTAAALYGQQQCRAAKERAAEEEEEVAPEDSASARVSPTNEVTNSLDALTLIRDELAASEDVVMSEEVPQGFEEALQSFWAVDDELEAVLSGDPEAQFDLSQQLGRWTGGPLANNAEVGLEVFLKQGVADTSPTIEWEVGMEPLPLEDDTSLAMSSLSSRLSDIAPHPGYPFWRYRRTTHSTPIMLPDMLPQWGVPQQANYVALNVKRHCNWLSGVIIGWTNVSSETGHCWDHVLARAVLIDWCLHCCVWWSFLVHPWCYVWSPWRRFLPL